MIKPNICPCFTWTILIICTWIWGILLNCPCVGGASCTKNSESFVLIFKLNPVLYWTVWPFEESLALHLWRPGHSCELEADASPNSSTVPSQKQGSTLRHMTKFSTCSELKIYIYHFDVITRIFLQKFQWMILGVVRWRAALFMQKSKLVW